MSDWKQTWKGEYIREFCKGEIGKILKHGFLWRVVLDDRRVDHIFLSAAEGQRPSHYLSCCSCLKWANSGLFLFIFVIFT